MGVSRKIVWVVVLALGAALLPTAAARAERKGLDSSQWRQRADEIDGLLRSRLWKNAKRAATRLADEILFTSWYDPKLRGVLADIAFYQAVAHANLKKQDAAIWYWHMAQNLDPRIRHKDFEPYGKAGALLLEFPLRKRGQAPASFNILRPGYGRKFKHARLDRDWAPTFPHNPGARVERPRDLHVELVVDKDGQPHHPVVLTEQDHPVVIYGTLDAMRTMPKLQPATDSGVPVDSLFKFIVYLRFSRWNQGGQGFPNVID